MSIKDIVENFVKEYEKNIHNLSIEEIDNLSVDFINNFSKENYYILALEGFKSPFLAEENPKNLLQTFRLSVVAV